MLGMFPVKTTSMAARVSYKDIGRLFLAHGRELQAYLTRKLRDAETAADLTQETFLRYTEQHGTGSAVAHRRSYLYRTAHNLAVDHIRREQRERTDAMADDMLAHIPHDQPSPEQAAIGRDELQRVRAALLELPERSRQVFVLARFEGLTYAAIARRLDISESSVQKHLAKAVQHVMRRMRAP